MHDELTQRVIAVITKTQRVAAENIAPDSTFEQLGMDSLDGVNLLFAVEEEFNVNIPDEAAREIRSVGQMVEGIRKLRDGAAPGGGMAKD